MAPPLHKAIACPRAFSKAVDAYIDSCRQAEPSYAPILAEFAVLQGFGSDMISKWADKYQEATEHDPELLIHQAIKRLKDSSEYMLQRKVQQSNSAGSMFLLKSKHKYVEQQHIKVDAKVSGSIAVVTGVSKPDGA